MTSRLSEPAALLLHTRMFAFEHFHIFSSQASTENLLAALVLNLANRANAGLVTEIMLGGEGSGESCGNSRGHC